MNDRQLQKAIELATNKYPDMPPRAAVSAYFIEEYCTSDGPGGGRQRFKLLSWQKETLAEIYKNGMPGDRLDINRVLISMGRKNGKTEFGSALVANSLAGPESPKKRGQIICAAGGNKEQAEIALRGTMAMFAEHPYLQSNAKFMADRLIWRPGLIDNMCKTISTKSAGAQGLRPNFWLYDEIASSSKRDHYETLNTATRPDTGGLGVIVSTRSTIPNSVFSQIYEEIIEAHRQGYGSQWLLKVWSADPSLGNLFTPEQLKLANPALGELLDLDQLIAEMQISQGSPQGRAEFRALRLNLASSSAASLVDAGRWIELGESPSPTKDEVYDRFEGKKVVISADLGEKGSLSALGVYWPTENYFLARCYMAKCQAEFYSTIHRAPYFQWCENGLMDLVEEDVTGGMTYLPMADEIIEIFDRFDVVSFRYDPWQITRLFKALRERGMDYEDAPMCNVLDAFRQGAPSYGEAINEFYDMILNGNLKHDNNGVVNYSINMTNVSNVNGIAGTKTIAKDHADSPNDAGAALLMAIASRTLDLKKEDVGVDFVKRLYATG